MYTGSYMNENIRARGLGCGVFFSKCCACVSMLISNQKNADRGPRIEFHILL